MSLIGRAGFLRYHGCMSRFIGKVLKQRRFRKLLLLLIWFSIVLGVLVVPVEQMGNGRIQTLGDGIWWAVSTITTVGYGDYVPVTPVGRLIGIMLQIVGAVMFGTLVAMISMAVDKTQAEFHWKRTMERFDHIEKILHHIEKIESYSLKNEQKK